MNLAFKDILHNKLRFIMTSFGLGLLLTVVMAMSGIYAGLVFEAGVLVDTLNADLWVVQKDTFGPFADATKISEIYGSVLGSIKGVREYNMVSFQTLQAAIGANKKRLTVVGLKKEPQCFSKRIISGNYIKSSHYEIVADISLGLKLGEFIRIGYDDFKVVGLTGGVVNSSGEAVVFMALQDAQKIQFQKNNEAVRNDKAQLKSSLNVNESSRSDRAKLEKIYNNRIVNAIILSTEKGWKESVLNSIKRWNYFGVFTTEEQIDILTKNVIEKPKKQLGLFKMILLIAATAIVMLIIYTLTQDKTKDIATLKLIGTPVYMIVGLILNQAIAMGLIGYATAFTIIYNTHHLFPRRVKILGEDMVSLFFIVFAMCVLASLLGIKKALNTDINQALGG